MGLFSKLKRLDPAKKLLKKGLKKDPLASKLIKRDPLGKKVLGVGGKKKTGGGIVKAAAAKMVGQSQPSSVKPMTTGGSSPATPVAKPMKTPAGAVQRFGELGKLPSNRSRYRY